MSSSESQLFRCLQSLDAASGLSADQLQAQQEACLSCYLDNGRPLDARLWCQLTNPPFRCPILPSTEALIHKLVYHCGLDHRIRSQVSSSSLSVCVCSCSQHFFVPWQVWPFLLEHYKFSDTVADHERKQSEAESEYKRLVAEWRPFEQVSALTGAVWLSVAYALFLSSL